VIKRYLPIGTQDHQFENDSEAVEGANRSEHSTFYRCQLNETVDSEKQYLEEGNSLTSLNDVLNPQFFLFFQGDRNIDSTWKNGSSQEKILFESRVQLITKQFLEAVANNQQNVKAENTSLKKELSIDRRSRF
jgi:hypothetical protein